MSCFSELDIKNYFYARKKYLYKIMDVCTCVSARFTHDTVCNDADL